MIYNIIIYELIIFKIKQNNNRMITKKYFQKIKTIENIDIKDLSNKIIKLKKIYRDNKYIIDFNNGHNIDYIEKLNNKSYKYYVNYVRGNYGK